MSLHALSGTDIRIQISDENAAAYNFVVSEIVVGSFTMAPGPKPRPWWIWQNKYQNQLSIYNKVSVLLNHMSDLNGGLDDVLDENGEPTRVLVKI